MKNENEKLRRVLNSKTLSLFFILAIFILHLQSFQYIIHTSYCIGTFIEFSLFCFIQIKIKNFFPAIFANNNGNAQANIFLPIFAIQANTTGK